METDALRRVREQAERKNMPPRGAGVVVGLSGGSDSLCLLILLSELAAEREQLDTELMSLYKRWEELNG